MSKPWKDVNVDLQEFLDLKVRLSQFLKPNDFKKLLVVLKMKKLTSDMWPGRIYYPGHRNIHILEELGKAIFKDNHIFAATFIQRIAKWCWFTKYFIFFLFLFFLSTVMSCKLYVGGKMIHRCLAQGFLKRFPDISFISNWNWSYSHLISICTLFCRVLRKWNENLSQEKTPTTDFFS